MNLPADVDARPVVSAPPLDLARLGAWLGNPGRAGAKTFDRSAPVQNVKPILDEMFGLTTDVSPYVYLSDGGHFENLALYEMVLRRCRFIVVSDAGADPSGTFDDLGNAVRKIRVDLGIPIEFVDGVPWAHLDIAGVADVEKPGGWRTRGCSGFGARLLADFAVGFGS